MERTGGNSKFESDCNMQRAEIIQFLRALGIESSAIEDSGRGFINCPCPLAAWTHSSGRDERPSFGISIPREAEGYSTFYCFGCHDYASGVGTLLHDYFVLSGEYPYEAAGIYARAESGAELDDSLQLTMPPDPYAVSTGKPPLTDPLPVMVLNKFPLLTKGRGHEYRKIREYLQGERLIPKFIQDMYRMRFNEHSRTMVFPLVDRYGRTFLMRERSRTGKDIWTVSPRVAGLSHLQFPRLKYNGVWFGMHLVDWSLPLMLVEGEIDAMRVAALGFWNVIASATSSVTKAQVNAVLDNHAGLLLLGYDADRSGHRAHERILEYVGKKTLIAKLNWRVAKCKDGGALKTKRQLRIVLKNRLYLT